MSIPFRVQRYVFLLNIYLFGYKNVFFYRKYTLSGVEKISIQIYNYGKCASLKAVSFFKRKGVTPIKFDGIDERNAYAGCYGFGV